MIILIDPGLINQFTNNHVSLLIRHSNLLMLINLSINLLVELINKAQDTIMFQYKLFLQELTTIATLAAVVLMYSATGTKIS